jgi:YVTN family beta-propeller protein
MPRTIAVLLVALGSGLLPSACPGADGPDLFRVGRLPDGRVAVPTNQMLQPAGRQVEFPGRPVDLALTDGGRTLVVKNFHDLVFLDTRSGEVRQTLASPAGFSVVGLLAGDGRVVVSDVKDHLRVAIRGENDKYTWTEPRVLRQPAIGGAVYPAGIARVSDQAVWVASTRGNSVQLVNLADGKVEQEVAVGVAPYAVVVPRPGLCYVTNWGGNPPKEGQPQALSSGSPTRVDARGIASRGSVSVLTPSDGSWRRVRSIGVGLHPSGMTVDRTGQLVYVANANSDTVSVIRTDTHEVVETIACRPEARLPFGSGCNALALSPDGTTLYVANGTNNAVAVVRLGAAASRAAGPLPTTSRLAGLIPTGWYPGAVVVSDDGQRLFVANVKGVGSLADKRAPAKGRNSHDHLGSVSIIDVPDDTQLAQFTVAVNANNRLAYSLAGLEKPRPQARPVPVPERNGEPSVFRHVIYVIKENRTYDQVFGDMTEGNGDPKLVLYGEDVTPNQHKLAREFTLLDNFYCSGVLSADGHQWTNEAYVTDYLEKAFGGFTRSYPFEGSDPLAYASSGFLWDNALGHGKTFRNFGEFVRSSLPEGATWATMLEESHTGAGKLRITSKVNVASLAQHTHPGYPGFVMSIPDTYRSSLFLEELAICERTRVFPNLVYLFLPCDHTNGTRPGLPTPRAMVADNDLALGRVVEAVSKSRFWKETCILVVEDDPQNGFDHVDGHRTVALAVSPYTRRRFVDSTCYNQTGMVRTIELILGLPPMNQLDLSATPMRGCFRLEADLSTYTAARNHVALDETNPPLARLKGEALHWAKASQELALDEVDEADEDTFNRILWHAARGDGVAYPEQYVIAKHADDAPATP